MSKELYPWQEDCLARWLSNGGRGMVQAVTGSGKTLLALTAADRLNRALDNQLHIKIVVPTGALMRQWRRTLQEYLTDIAGKGADPAGFRQEIGLRGAGFSAPPDCKYMIYVINSARYELARQILAEVKSGIPVFLIADECHRYESGQNRLIFEFLPYIKEHSRRFFSLGLSATLPTGQAKSYLASVLGKQIYSYGMAQAASLRQICYYDAFHIGLSFHAEENDAYQNISDRMKILYSNLLHAHPSLKDMGQKERFELLRTLTGDRNQKTAEAAALYMKLSYKRKNLVCLAKSRIQCAYELVKRLPGNEKILIFGERIQQAEELYQLLRESFPGRVGRYHSQLGQQANRNALNRFRDGDDRILIACKSIDEGLNVPDASVGIILSGASMERQRIQRLGRILRKKEGKERAALYYLHITDSAEDRVFLPASAESRIFELEYATDSRDFIHPGYDRVAAALLRKLSFSEQDPARLAEVQRCLRLGCVRADWLLSDAAISQRLHAAASTGEKNYWICMKKMAQLSEKCKGESS